MLENEMRFGWAERFVAEQAATAKRMAGYYNHNYRIDQGGQLYLVRIPIPNSDVMDLRRINETDLLRYIERCGIQAPRVLYFSDTQNFAVHSWVHGEALHELYSDDNPMPDWIPERVAEKMARLHAIDPRPFAVDCKDLGVSPDTQSFFLAHFEFDRHVHRRLLPATFELYAGLGIPDTPFQGLDRLAGGIQSRPFVLCHSDIHRKNILVRPDVGDLTILDWELALVGDPIYDIAVHFHKMRYASEQEERFIDHYIRSRNTGYRNDAVRAEVDLYLTLERVKSAVIDAFRARGDIKTRNLSRDEKWALATRYARKLDRARAVWLDRTNIPPSDVAIVLDMLSTL